MSIAHRFTAAAAAACLALTSLSSIADEHPYSQGPVINVASIRTVDGKFDDYMKWLDTTWKAEQEAAKAAGYILGYQVLTAEARGPNDPDVLLVIRYKNWAALDDSIAKGDAISKKIEGSIEAANQSEAARSSIRRVLGSQTYQVMDLK